jgi:K+-sensing histidine kinase KdpD
VTLLGDPLRIKQILINLFDNALKFTERGSITLRAGVLTETADDLSFSIAITDTGKGIPAEAQGGFSRPSNRPTARPPASTAAPGSAWPSSASSAA